MSTKPTNPKDAIGSNKLPVHLWPPTATLYGSLGLLDGMLKYGRTNWRPGGARASIYYDAMMRHMFAWWEGVDFDPDSGLPQMAHVLACAAIILDAAAAGTLNDDRAYVPEGGDYLNQVKHLTPYVESLKRMRAGEDPKHWTRADND